MVRNELSELSVMVVGCLNVTWTVIPSTVSVRVAGSDFPFTVDREYAPVTETAAVGASLPQAASVTMATIPDRSRRGERVDMGPSENVE